MPGGISDRSTRPSGPPRIGRLFAWHRTASRERGPDPIDGGLREEVRATDDRRPTTDDRRPTTDPKNRPRTRKPTEPHDDRARLATPSRTTTTTRTIRHRPRPPGSPHHWSRVVGGRSSVVLIPAPAPSAAPRSG